MTKLFRLTTPIGLLLTLAACGGSPVNPDPAKIDVRPPDAALTDPCEPVRWLPDRALTQAEVEVKWREDRENLIDCGERHRLLAAYALELVGEVSGGAVE